MPRPGPFPASRPRVRPGPAPNPGIVGPAPAERPALSARVGPPPPTPPVAGPAVSGVPITCLEFSTACEERVPTFLPCPYHRPAPASSRILVLSLWQVFGYVVSASYQLLIQVKAKKTRKFALVKRMLNPKDIRLYVPRLCGSFPQLILGIERRTKSSKSRRKRRRKRSW